LQLRQWLVGAEVSLSTLLLVLAGLLVSSLWHVLHVDRGFTAGRALEVRVSLPSRYRSVQDRALSSISRTSAFARFPASARCPPPAVYPSPVNPTSTTSAWKDPLTAPSIPLPGNW